MRDQYPASIVSTQHPVASRSAVSRILMDVRTFATDCKKLAKKAEDYAVVVNAENTSAKCVRARAEAVGGAQRQ